MNTFKMFFGSCVLLLVLTGSIVKAQDAPVSVDVDHAVFAYSDSTSLVELYFAFDASSLPFEAADTGYQASVPVRVKLLPESGASNPVWSDSLVFRFNVEDTADAGAGRMFLQQLRASVPPGMYALAVDSPHNTRRSSSMRLLEHEVVVEDFSSGEAPSFSEIALASRIQTSDSRESPFYKHGLLVRPNPRSIYGRGLSRLYYYVEMYNAEAVSDADDRYRVHSYITPVHQDTPIDSLARETSRDVRSPDVLVGQFNVSGLPSGSYELHTEVRGDSGESVASRRRIFYVYNPDVERDPAHRTAGPAVSARYRTMGEEMVDVAVAAVAEIASESERTTIDQLDTIDEKKQFLTRFWARRDETPGTPVNERENEFYRSLRMIRKQYSSPFKEAWETDRGRTMLQYGPPSQIDSHLHERETQPFVVWHYDHLPGQGEAVFVFIDREGFGEFDLVHSTARGEIKNPEWRRFIQ